MARVPHLSPAFFAPHHHNIPHNSIGVLKRIGGQLIIHGLAGGLLGIFRRSQKLFQAVLAVGECRCFIIIQRRRHCFFLLFFCQLHASPLSFHKKTRQGDRLLQLAEELAFSFFSFFYFPLDIFRFSWYNTYMMKITIKCKLNPTQRQIRALEKTLSKCLRAMNYISQIAWKKKCFNRVALHHLVYYRTKAKFRLSPQICCDVKDKVCFSYKSEKKKQHIFKQHILPLSYNRSLSLNDIETASVSTSYGREKIALILGEYQKQMLSKATKFRNSEIMKRNDKYFLNLVIEIPDEPIKAPTDVLGVDLGIKKIAVCSNGTKFTGEQIQSVRNRYHALRQRLQSKGTRSAKRRLKKISGREKRFQKDVNHRISKQIASLANQHSSAIALEDLTNIRKTARHRKRFRRIFHRWAFFQLRQFISYKAQMSGIQVILVDPAYTSQICSQCGSFGIRNAEHFSCPFCGFFADADYNASLNIRSRAVVNQPIAAPDDAEAPLGELRPRAAASRLL